MTRIGPVLAVVGVGLCGGDVRFDPAPGTELVRTLEFEGETAFECWSVVWNGREAPAEALPELWIEGCEEARAVVREPTYEQSLRLVGRTRLTCEVR